MVNVSFKNSLWDSRPLAKVGEQVRFLGRDFRKPEADLNHHERIARKKMIPGSTYTVATVDRSEYFCLYVLEQVPGYVFKSTLFERIPNVIHMEPNSWVSMTDLDLATVGPVQQSAINTHHLWNPSPGDIWHYQLVSHRQIVLRVLDQDRERILVQRFKPDEVVLFLNDTSPKPHVMSRKAFMAYLRDAAYPFDPRKTWADVTALALPPRPAQEPA